MMLLNQSIGKFEIVLSLFLLVYLLGLCILTPPFQVADENAHFYRAVQVSQFEVFPSRHENLVGGSVPISLVESANILQSGIPFNVQNKFSLKILRTELSKKFDESDKKFVSFPNTALYSPVPYIFAGTALWILKKISPTPPLHLYVSRITNVVSAVSLIFISINISPFLAIPVLMLAFIPMFSFQLASLSADSIMFAISVFYACSLARAFVESKSNSDKHLQYFAASTFSFALLILCKQAYLPMGFPLLILLFSDFEKKKMFLVRAGLSVLAGVPVLYWNYRIQSFFVPTRVDVLIDPAKQLKFILTSSDLFINLMIRSLSAQRDALWQEMIGVLGWMDTWLNPKINDSLGFLLILSVLMVPRQKSPLSYVTNLLVLIGIIFSAFLVIVLIYMSWNPPGYLQNIEGLQGRYFLPLLPLAFVLFACRSRVFLPKFLSTGSLFSKIYICSFIGLSLWTTIYGLIKRYYI